MHDKLTETEIELLEAKSDPTALTECLIPEDDSVPHAWPNCKCLVLRPYQFAMQNYSYMIADDPELSFIENFKLKKVSGDLYSIGARNLGKSRWLMVDVVLTFIKKCKEGCLASVTYGNLKKVAEPICKFIESHKYCKIFHLQKETTRSQTVKRNPFEINAQHGSRILSVNEQVDGDKPGRDFQGKHFDIRWTEEISFSTKDGQENAEDAEMSYGHIERPSGIPDLHMDSPLEKFLRNKKLKDWIWKLPQYVRSDFTDEVEQKKTEFYNGKSTSAYKLNVEAETLEGAFGFFDVGRMKEASFYKTGRIKNFEIGLKTFQGFENIIHVERPSGTEKVFISADIGGGSAPTEIIIVFWDGTKFVYEYNITINRLIQDEQAEIFYWLYETLGGAFVSIDSSHDGGVIIDRLVEKGIPRDHCLKVSFKENIEVGFEKDENGEIILDGNGDPIMQKAHTVNWSFSELEKIFYSGDFKMPPDAKFEEQIANIICKKTKSKTLFDHRGPNHLVQGFQCFAISKFFNEFNNVRSQFKSSKRGYCA